MAQPLRCAQCGATQARNGNEFSERTLRVQVGRRHGPGKEKNGEGPYRLTGKEHDVVLLLAAGLTRPEVAGRLNMTTPSLRTQVWRIRLKLAAKRQVEAAVIWFEENLTEGKDFRDGKWLPASNSPDDGFRIVGGWRSLRDWLRHLHKTNRRTRPAIAWGRRGI